MPINILMPALSPTMEKGNLAKWHVKEGDKVSSGDVIAEIETDKATMEVEAVDEGTIARLLIPEGTADVPVNDIIAVLAAEGEDVASAQPQPQGGGSGGSPGSGSDQTTTSISTGKFPEASVRDLPGPTPAQGYGREDVAPGTEAGTLPNPFIFEDHGSGGSARPDGSQAQAGRSGNRSTRLFASPLARRMARQEGLDLALLQGSGPQGRIVKSDIEKALQDGTGRPTAAPSAHVPQTAPQAREEHTAPAVPIQPPAGPGAAPQVPAMSDEAIRKLFTEGSYEVIPHDNMRKTIARRLTEAKSTIPHFYLTTDCDIDALLKLRAELNAAAPTRGNAPAYKLSVNDLVIKALAMALQAVPDANVTWTSEGMLKHRRSDVGVAVSIPGGLITPVIRNAEVKTLSAISNEMKDMAVRARARKLKPEEYQGGTTAVSNLGMYGVKDFAAVINPPHATILAVGTGEPRAVVRDGVVVVATMMSVTLSTDHRAVDGALGAELLAAFKGYIEKPMGMLV